MTWYFARGPRQATSLDGSFASKHPADQRIFNWTAIFDEVDDFEGNTRDISGGVGAIVSSVSMPPQTADRIDFAGLGHAGLSGSSSQAADSANPLGFTDPPKLADWSDITKYMPATATNTALKTAPLAIPQGLPAGLLPATQPANQLLRFGGPNAAAFDQILCAIRPIGTFKVAEAGRRTPRARARVSSGPLLFSAAGNVPCALACKRVEPRGVLPVAIRLATAGAQPPPRLGCTARLACRPTSVA